MADLKWTDEDGTQREMTVEVAGSARTDRCTVRRTLYATPADIVACLRANTRAQAEVGYGLFRSAIRERAEEFAADLLLSGSPNPSAFAVHDRALAALAAADVNARNLRIQLNAAVTTNVALDRALEEVRTKLNLALADLALARSATRSKDSTKGGDANEGSERRDGLRSPTPTRVAAGEADSTSAQPVQPNDPRPKCIACDKRWTPPEGVDATIYQCEVCDAGRPWSAEARPGPKFRKRPVVVEAERFDGTPGGAVIVFTRFDIPGGKFVPNPDLESGTLFIPTLEGNHTASAGDWIIRGVKGEFYPCKPDIFEATYETAE